MTRSLLKIHTWTALITVVPLLVICLTGSVLVFKHEIDTLLMSDKVRVEEAGRSRQSLDTLLDNVNAVNPNHEVVGWVLFQDAGRADLVYVMEHGTSEWSYVLLNQYTGEQLAPPRSTTHYLTDWLLELHYTLLLDHAGLAITSIISIMFCLLGLTGLFIYRAFWKNLFALRWGKRRTVFFTDLHRLVGVVGSPIFLILGFTGAWWNITHFYHEEIEEVEHEHHIMQGRLYNEELPLEAMRKDAESRIAGFTPTYFLMPYEPGINVTFWGEVPTANFLASEYSSTVTYSAQTGEYISATDIRTAPMGAQIVDTFRELHFGTFGGLFTKILWCVAGVAPLALSITGIYVWYSRKRKRRQARAKRQTKRSVGRAALG